MKLAIYQFAPLFGQIDKNIETVRQAVSGKDFDILILPELAFTGYQFVSSDEVAELSEEVPGGPTCRAVEEIAAEKSCYVVFGLPEKSGGDVFNSAALIGPNGFIGKYRKAHLFYEEKLWFKPGDTGFHVFDIGLARIGIIICFDWIYPEASRILMLKGAQVIVQPANLVLPWCQKIALARAWENRVFFVTANRTGQEERGGREPLDFTGQSQAVAPSGELLFRMAENEQALHIIDVDPSLADNKQVTLHNDIMKDRRTDLYGPLLR